MGWQAFLEDARQVTFQIWRSIATNKYTLIGQSVYNPTHSGNATLTLPDNETYDIKKGDVKGLYFHGQCNIPNDRLSDFKCHRIKGSETCVVDDPGESVLGRTVSCVASDECLNYSERAILLPRE